MNLIEIYHRKNLFVSRIVGEESILVPLTDNIATMSEIFRLNEVGSFIWNKIDGRNNEEDIVKAIADEFSIDHDTARSDMEEFISDLAVIMNRNERPE